MKNKKPIIALGALAVVGLIAGTIAYFTSEATFDNVFQTAVYKTQSTEVFNSPDNWTPGQEVTKTVVTENKGTIPVAVRVSTAESWKDENNQEIPAATITNLKNSLPEHDGVHEDIAVINLANDYATYWTYQDGYHYYKKALAAKASDAAQGETTHSFIKSVTLNSNLSTESDCGDPVVDGDTKTITCTTSITGLGKATYTLTITVDTVQYDQYQTVWFPSPASPVEILGPTATLGA